MTVVRNYRTQMIEPRSVEADDIESFITHPECTTDTLKVAVIELAGKLRRIRDMINEKETET